MLYQDVISSCEQGDTSVNNYIIYIIYVYCRLAVHNYKVDNGPIIIYEENYFTRKQISTP